MATKKSPIKDHNLQIAATPDKLSCSENSSISSSSSQNKPIILQLNTNSFSASQKLKSLLPKSLLHQALRQEPEIKSYSVSHETELQPGAFGTNISGFTTSDAAIHSQSGDAENKDNLNAASIDFGYSVTTLEAIESILRQLNSNISPSNILENNADKQQQPEFEQSVEKCGSFEEESLHNEHDSNETHPPTTNNPVVTNHDINPEGSAPPVSHDSSEDQDKDKNVVKKTMVEAFVKMVVCRKVTVQKVHAKTGEILETKVKTEEEEPVILGVDCVETTEDLMSAPISEFSLDNAADIAASKWGASLDGGLKFLSAVSESRQKIGKSVLKERIKKSTKSMESGVQKEPLLLKSAEDKTIDASHVKEDTGMIKTEQLTDSENDDWNEELNDDSEDYVPNSHQISAAKLSSKNIGLHLSQINPNNKKTLNVENDDSVILMHKKRGRKRKWGNALGMASNLRNCVFCNKRFSSISSCAEHMKNGKCISSLYCFICSKTYNSEEELEKHLSSHGNEPKSKAFDCSDCFRSYRTRAGYEKHFRMGTCVKKDELEEAFLGPIQCELCPSRFSTQGYLRLHRYKVHENPKDTHTCLDCGKKFYSSLGFYKHKNGRPCTEPLKCWVCGKTYASKAKESFKIHMKHHKSEVGGITFHCDECGRGYMTQMALAKHKISHTGVKPYKCDICGKTFSMRYMVKDHARMHTGERPYLCSLCGSAFSNKGHLGRHLRSHENGTLLKRGRPKKIKEPGNSVQDTELKIIDLGQTLQNFDGQSIQVVNGQLFEAQTPGAPMIIQANNNTIIIAESWPPSNSSSSSVTLPTSHDITHVS